MESVEKYYLQPGCIFVSEQAYLIHTVVGSCVAVCLWDSINGFGGMNHFIYDCARNNTPNGKFGDVSTQYLIRLMLDMGTRKPDIKAHIIGGGQNPMINSTIGRDNVLIAEEILGRKGIKVVTREVGGLIGRKVIFNNESGEILIYKVSNIRKNDWY